MLKTQASKLSHLGLYPHVAKQFYPPPANSVLYLPGYPPGESTIYDKSGNGLNGIITGATWVRLPSGLWAITNGGTGQFVSIADTGSVLSPAALTAEIWVKFTTLGLPSPQNNPCILGKKDTTYNQADGWALNYDDGGFFGFRGSGGTYATSAGFAASIGVWYHTRITVSGTTVTWYVNGVSLETGTIDAITSNTDTLKIGKMSADYPSWLNALWSHAKIYNAVVAGNFQQERGLFGV